MERSRIYITMGEKLTVEEMNELEKNITDFLTQHNIKLEVPVDIFNVADDLGFDVRGVEFPSELEGMILVNEQLDTISGFNSNKIIAYNLRKDIDSKKFIVGHELAHYIEVKVKNPNAKVVTAARERVNDYKGNREEQKKDYMAAALLVPKDDLRERYDSVNEENIEQVCGEVAETYNVHIDIAKRRIQEVFYGKN